MYIEYLCFGLCLKVYISTNTKTFPIFVNLIFQDEMGSLVMIPQGQSYENKHIL